MNSDLEIDSCRESYVFDKRTIKFQRRASALFWNQVTAIIVAVQFSSAVDTATKQTPTNPIQSDPTPTCFTPFIGLHISDNLGVSAVACIIIGIIIITGAIIINIILGVTTTI